jgi:dinuclear metal center YbgI/SA1388 family protein
MQLKEIIRKLEELAPPKLQESYDNSGLLTGSPDQEVNGVLVSLDCTEAIVDEAILTMCNVIVCHHPIIFSGLKRLTGKNYIERVIIKAIRSGVAIYSIHTNLDNVAHGVNQQIASRLGLVNTRVLDPVKNRLRLLVTYCPEIHFEQVRNALFGAGAGHISNYDECSFSQSGTGTFRPLEGANPFSGDIGTRSSEKEIRLEMVFDDWKETAVLGALFKAHPYEEVAYHILEMQNSHPMHGAGMIGELPQEMGYLDFLAHVKKNLKTNTIRYTSGPSTIKTVALCGGSGSFLLGKAMAAGADTFITGDFKYHQIFDAENKIMIADVGHFESEQFTINLLADYLREKFTNFAVRLTELSTNPINYF